MIRFTGGSPVEVVDSHLHELTRLLRIRDHVGQAHGVTSSEYLNADIEYHLAKECYERAKDGRITLD